jgi:hypothetical protein
MENTKLKTKNKKPSKFKCYELSVLIICMSFSVSIPGDGASDVVL